MIVRGANRGSTRWGWSLFAQTIQALAFVQGKGSDVYQRFYSRHAVRSSGNYDAAVGVTHKHDWALQHAEQILRHCYDIEFLKQTQEKLREEEQELRRITDAIPQAIVVLDPSGAPVYANYATLDYTGLTAKDAVSPRFRERMFHPDDLERLRDERKAALGRGVPFEAELRARRKDGEYRWFLIRYNPFRNEQWQLTRWYATGTDIDDRVRAEERTRNENLALREQIDRDWMFEDIVGSSEALGKVLRRVSKVASSDSTVLILGETGTGKELIARAMHKRSKRAERAFIGVNCAAIPSSLIASELFGHEKGAFTGATQRRAWAVLNRRTAAQFS